MSTADEDRWDDDVMADVRSDLLARQEYAQQLHRETVARAKDEVNMALFLFKRQSPWRTRLAKLRFSLYWMSYKPREVLAVWLVRFICWASKKDSRLVSQKVTGWLSLLDKGRN